MALVWVSIVLVIVTLTMENETPRKAGKSCCVCKEEPKEKRSVSGKNRRGQNITDLLLEYGDLNVSEGILCRSCYNKLLKINQSIADVREKCHSTKLWLKRYRPLTPLVDISNFQSELKPKSAKRSLLEDSGFNSSDTGIILANLSHISFNWNYFTCYGFSEKL